MKSYESVKPELKTDGSLRDIYLYQANPGIWNNFLSIVSGSKLNYEFWHGEMERPPTTNFEKIRSLQSTDPTTLKIFIKRDIQINCHFYIEGEIEMDADPKEISDKNKFDSLVSFLR